MTTPTPEPAQSPTAEPKSWPAFAGIDWGSSHHQLCILDPTGRRQSQLRVTHDVAGLADLDTELARHGHRLPISVERSEGLLVEHLQARGHPVFPVSPRIAARARERYRVAAVKDDRFDAFVLADTLRHEHQHWRALAVPSPLLAEIKALTRDRDRLLETQQAIESQLRMILEAYHPAPVRLFSSVDRQITLHFVLDYPTPQTASRVKTTRMAGFLGRHHYTGRVSAQVLAERMRTNLLTASPGTVAGKSFSAQSFTRLLQLLNSPARRLRRRHRRRGRRAPRHAHLRQLPRRRSGPDRGAARRDRRGPLPIPHLGGAACRVRARPGHPRLGTLPQRPVPLRRQHPPARGRDVVGLQLHEGRPLGRSGVQGCS